MQQNPELVLDCEALLASKDLLSGNSVLNWSPEIPMSQWDGIVLSGVPSRVTEIDFGGILVLVDGGIPPELGRLDALTKLSLDGHQLTGEIPPELGRLTNLTWLDLGSNKLSGHIPGELRALTNLKRLALYQNELTGEIPPWLGELSELERLALGSNQLTGEIPMGLGQPSPPRPTSWLTWSR